MLILLTLLPVFVSSTLHVYITPASNSSLPSITYNGSATWPLSIDDQRPFHITDDEIYSKSKKTWYKKPYNVFKLGGGPDLKGVMVSAKITGANIFHHLTKPVLVGLRSLTNRKLEPVMYNGTLKADVKEFLSSTWAECPVFGGKVIKLHFGAERISYESALGEDVFRLSAKTTIEADSGFVTTLQPSEGVDVVLQATQATLQAKIDYEVTIAGKVCVKYYWFYLVPQNKCYDVRKYTSNVIRAREVISVDYYYGAYVNTIPIQT